MNDLASYSLVGSSTARDLGRHLRFKQVNATPGGQIVRGPKNISSIVEEAVQKDKFTIIIVGGNDCSERSKLPSPPDIIEDYKKKVKALVALRKRNFQKKEGHLIFTLLLPRYLNSSHAVTAQNNRINTDLKNIIRKSREQGENWISWIETQELTNPRFFKSDQIHLNFAGNQKLAQLIKETAMKSTQITQRKMITHS